jgi:hypothetical protein
MTPKRARENGELQEALAILISSTRSKRRPLPLTEIAHWLKLAVAKLGSYSAVADRIGLSSKMLRQFSSVDRLAVPVQKLFQGRQLDSVDAATHLAMLSIADQKTLAKALALGKVDTSDVRAVIQLRQAGQSGPISRLLHRVRESKSKQEYVAEFVVRGDATRATLLRTFQNYIPSREILRLEIEGAVGRLVLTSRGKQALSKAARKAGVSMRNVIPTLLYSLNPR